MSLKKLVLPPYIVNLYPNVDKQPFDSCFVPKGFLFPESREDVAPMRSFPLSEPFYAPARVKTSDPSNVDLFTVEEDEDDDASSIIDSTILRINETDEVLLEIQDLGLQYTIHVQMCLRDDLIITAPASWDRTQSLLTNIPVFEEELCQWHYPISQIGYNSSNIDPPIELNIADNMPRLFGYLPNGDIAVYWELAEALVDEFDLDLEPLHTNVTDNLILLPGLTEDERYNCPVGSVTETGIVLTDFQMSYLPDVLSYGARCMGRKPIVLKANPYIFYRLKLPVIQCEWDCNLYAEATWGALAFTLPRLSGFEFKVVNNPFSRKAPIFATENGNVIVSLDFYDKLRSLHQRFGMPLTTRSLPIQRIP